MSKPRQTIKVVPIQTLTAHPGNIREDLGDLSELARSIVEHGILEPLVVTDVPGRSGRYLVLAGHRRLRAALLARQTSVPVVIRHGVTDESEQIALMLVENGHRKDLTPVEKAEAFGALRNHGLSQTAIAKLTGYHTSSVNYYLTLLDLDEQSLDQVRSGVLPSTVAIQAVQDARQAQRVANLQPQRGRPVVSEKPHFTVRHPLAKQVFNSCDHTTRPKVGSIGCGQCWEEAIRADAGGVPVSTPDRVNERVDDVAVQRVIEHADYALVPTLTATEKIELVRRWQAAGRSLNELSRLTGLKPERYQLGIGEAS